MPFPTPFGCVSLLRLGHGHHGIRATKGSRLAKRAGTPPGRNVPGLNVQLNARQLWTGRFIFATENGPAFVNVSCAHSEVPALFAHTSLLPNRVEKLAPVAPGRVEVDLKDSSTSTKGRLSCSKTVPFF